MSSCRRTATQLVLAAIFALAWRYDLLLVVVGMAAAAIAMVVRERLAELAAVRRAIALATHMPIGVHDASSLEKMIAADLSAVAGDDVDALIDASGIADATFADPWRRALATERLGRAAAHARRAIVPRPIILTVLRHRSALPAAAAGAVGLLAVSAWIGSALTLAPLTFAVAVLALAEGERRCAIATRRALVLEAAAEPAEGSVLVPEAAIIGAIETIADKRPRVRRLATSLVATSEGPESERVARRLHAVPHPRRRLSRTDHAVATWASAATVLTLLIGR